MNHEYESEGDGDGAQSLSLAILALEVCTRRDGDDGWDERAAELAEDESELAVFAELKKAR